MSSKKGLWIALLALGLGLGLGGALSAAQIAACETTAAAASAPSLGTLEEPDWLGPEPCGDRVCGANQFCCNPTCSLCLPEDQGLSCTQEVCDDPPTSPGLADLPGATDQMGGPPFEECGDVVCGPNFYCCNRSCSICAPDGGFCTQQVCE